jgi:hypothetical protein
MLITICPVYAPSNVFALIQEKIDFIFKIYIFENFQSSYIDSQLSKHTVHGQSEVAVITLAESISAPILAQVKHYVCKRLN